MPLIHKGDEDMLMDSLNIKYLIFNILPFLREPAGSLSEYIKSVTAVSQTRD